MSCVDTALGGGGVELSRLDSNKGQEQGRRKAGARQEKGRRNINTLIS